MTADEVLVILDAGDFDQLIGVAEDEDLEFKGQPYRFDDDRQAFEYAKDVSALANGRGGLLLVGFVTERTAGSATDTVSEVRPFDRALFDEAQCVDKVRQLRAGGLRWRGQRYGLDGRSRRRRGVQPAPD